VVSHDIYVLSVKDKAVERLTTDGLRNRDPGWSPDGEKIVFARAESGQSDIFVMNADGSERRVLVSGQADEIMPSWSPDGTRIAFASNREPS
jgi:Tol biopolymer transport system component